MFGSLQKFLQRENLDLALFFNSDANITYFADVKTDLGCLAIPASGKALLFVPGFEAERLAKLSRIKVVKVGSGFLKDVHKLFPGKNIGIIPGLISYSQAHSIQSEWNARLVNIEDFCKKLRAVKSHDEIRRITKACAITDALFAEVCSVMHLFKTELDVANFLKLRISQLGLETSFPPIVASGKNGAVPHHIPSNAKLKGFTVIDFGIIYKNYCSDITRTVFFGVPSAKDRKVYQNLLKIQAQCVRKALVGAKLEELSEFAQKSVGKTMIHRVGHSLGIEVHDVQPRPFVLEAGNVITIEPGTYPGKFGIRIEDDVLITEKGPVLLTKSPKNLRVFGRKV